MSRESDKQKYSPWLGGVFESAATMLFLAHPVAGYSDQSREKLEKIKDVFGGNIVKNPPRYWRLLFPITEIFDIARLIQPYTPSRMEIIKAILTWEKEKDCNKKLLIVSGVKGRERLLDEVTEDQYTELISNPLFVAGMFESRGYIQRRYGKADLKKLTISSVNETLLKALQREFGGNICANSIRGKYIYLSTENAYALLHFIQPYMLTTTVEDMLSKKGITRL